MCYSFWYKAPTMLPAGSLEAELVASSWLSILFTSMMHSQANIKFT